MSQHVDLSQLMTIDQVIRRAGEIIDPGIQVWAAAGAGQGVTLARNQAALHQLALVPRVLRDVSQVETGSSFVGIPLDIPVMLAPVGALGLYDPGDSLAAAEAASRVGTSAYCGILTGSPWEQVAATSPGRHFFQLYVLGDRAWLGEVIARVEAAGFAGICVTVDTPVIGRRDRAIEIGFTWTIPPEGPLGLAGLGIDYSYRARFTWDDLEWLGGQTKLPVIVKGVMTGPDAARAVESGVAGIYVSNHGGRVLDHELSTIEVLGDVVEEVADRADVMVDGGFTRGADICKALALGARAVGIGRLQCWGLALGGADGLAHVLGLLRIEIVNTMANIGSRTVEEISPEHLRWSIPVSPPEPP